MRKAKIFMHGVEDGILAEIDKSHYSFSYLENYSGPPISLMMPVREKFFEYDEFPPFFDGVLPEGEQLTALLKAYKIDSRDYFSQLIRVGEDLVGAVTVEEWK